MLIKRSMSAKLLTTPAYGHLVNAELDSVPPERRGARPYGSFMLKMKLSLIKKILMVSAAPMLGELPVTRVRGKALYDIIHYLFKVFKYKTIFKTNDLNSF